MKIRTSWWAPAVLLAALVAFGACASGDDDDDDSDAALSHAECVEGMDAVYDCALVSVEDGETELTEEQAVERCADGEDIYECFAQCALDQISESACSETIIPCIESECRTTGGAK
ncbi:MAG: hypothetical protein KC466_00600 [Myxococcales bacterium]|nr:hypothetical protein [Myxococcales bacterium]